MNWAHNELLHIKYFSNFFDTIFINLKCILWKLTWSLLLAWNTDGKKVLENSFSSFAWRFREHCYELFRLSSKRARLLNYLSQNETKELNFVCFSHLFLFSTCLLASCCFFSRNSPWNFIQDRRRDVVFDPFQFININNWGICFLSR